MRVLGQFVSLEEMPGPPLLLHSYGGVNRTPLSEDPLPREQREGPPSEAELILGGRMEGWVDGEGSVSSVTKPGK